MSRRRRVQSSSGGRETLTWRDAAVRTRTEQNRVRGGRGCLDDFVPVQEPVAGVGYVLDQQEKPVYGVQLTAKPAISVPDRAASMAARAACRTPQLPI
jgi:hypothetical protein